MTEEIMTTENQPTIEGDQATDAPVDAPEPAQKALGDQLEFDWSALDSTSVLRCEIVQDGEPVGNSGDDLLEKLLIEQETIQADESVSAEDKVAGLTGVIKKMYGKVMARNEMNNAHHSIHIGEAALELKKLVTIELPSIKWTAWVKENVAFCSLRTLQDCMKLAKSTHAHDYAFLGKDQLLTLLRVTRDFEGEDPIGDFLKAYDVPYDPDREINTSQFRFEINVAVDRFKLRKAGIDIGADSVRRLRRAGAPVSSRLISDLKPIAESKSDPEAFVDLLIRKAEGDKTVVLPGRAARVLRNATKRINSALGSIEENKEPLSQEDRNDLVTLGRKLSALSQPTAGSDQPTD